MDVRLARPTDAPLVLGLSLDDSAHLVKGSGWPTTDRATHAVWHALAPLALRGRMWVARDDSSAAVLQARPRRYVIGWDVTRLAARGDSPNVIPAVIGAATEHIQSRGVPRLFARCAGPGSEELKQHGFLSLAREFVLVGPGEVPLDPQPLPDDTRYRMPQDAWPIHQLESAVTPPFVRQVEGLTSLDWSQRIPAMSEIVVEREGRVVAWIGWGTYAGRGLRQLGLLIEREYQDLARGLLVHVLQNATPGRQFVARVRDYQTEVLRAFLDTGFQVVAEEDLMVKHALVEPARARARMHVARVPGIQAFHYHLGILAVPSGRRQAVESGLKEK